MTEFKKLISLHQAPKQKEICPYKFKEFHIRQEYKDVQSIEFSPTTPSHYLVTAGARVKIYNATTEQIILSLHKIHSTVFSGTFRNDGNLFALGTSEGHVKIHYAKPGQSQNHLLLLKGHQKLTACVRFTNLGRNIVSFSDDQTIKLWDYPSEKEIQTFTGHTDFVRTGSVCFNNPSLILSGSNDKTAKIFDTRVGSSPVLSVDHGYIIEKVLFYPSADKFISAGNVFLKWWDIRNGNQIHNLVEHSDTISDICLSSSNRYLFSSSADKLVKVYNASSYKAIRKFNFDDPVRSIALSSDENYFVLGMRNYLKVLHQSEDKKSKEQKGRKRKRPQGFSKSHLILGEDGQITSIEEMETLNKRDQALRVFDYGKALSVSVGSMRPETTLALLQELMHRNAVESALVSLDNLRPEKMLLLVNFIKDNLGTPYHHIVYCFAEAIYKLHSAEKLPNSNLQAKHFGKIKSRLIEFENARVPRLKVAGIIEVFQKHNELMNLRPRHPCPITEPLPCEELSDTS